MALDKEYIGSPDNPRTTAVVSYITILGWLLAYFTLYPLNKSSLSRFHMRQALLLHIIEFFLMTVFSFALSPSLILTISMAVAGVSLFILWLMGLLSALNGTVKPLPIFGELSQRLFSKL